MNFDSQLWDLVVVSIAAAALWVGFWHLRRRLDVALSLPSLLLMAGLWGGNLAARQALEQETVRADGLIAGVVWLVSALLITRLIEYVNRATPRSAASHGRERK